MDSILIDQMKIALFNIGAPIARILENGVPWFFPFAFIGLIVAIIIMGVLRKKKLLVRKYRTWNALAKLSYLALLIVIPISFGVAGALYHTQVFTQKLLEQELLPAINKQMPAFNEYISSQIKLMDSSKLISVKDLIDPFLNDLYYTPQSDDMLEKLKARIINKVILQTVAEALTKGLQERLIAQVESLGLALSEHDFRGHPQDEMVKLGVDVVSKFTIDTAKQIDFTKVNATLPQVIVDALTKAVDGYFKSFYKMICLVLILLAFMIMAEILYYRRYLAKIQ